MLLAMDSFYMCHAMDQAHILFSFPFQASEDGIENENLWVPE